MSAVPAREREEVRRLLELVPDEDLPTLRRIVRALVAETAVFAAFDSAPLDDEGELSDEMIAKLAESDRAIVEGRVVSHEEGRQRLGL